MTPAPNSIERDEKLNLEQTFPKYWLEKQNPISVSMHWVEYSSMTMFLAENKSYLAEPLVNFLGQHDLELK